MATGLSPGLVRALIKPAVGSGFYVALAFLGAGSLDWNRGWLYAVVFVGVSVAGSLIVRFASPGLLEERAKGIRKDTKPFDRLFYALFLPVVLFYPFLAGLDAERFSWAPLPWWTIYPGVLCFLAGSLITTWTMVVNRHAETTVRIQSDRSHAVVTNGPYTVVRHPMYVGTLLGLPGAALMLGSGWALLPMALIMMLFVWRTAREDRALRQELAGYEDYAAITHHRLVPGLW
jgi:protein-S-isoprenylcysteine O-methyltransferase Ste14